LFRDENYRNIGCWKRSVRWNTLSHERQTAKNFTGVVQGEGSIRRTQAANVRRNWDARRSNKSYYRGGSLSKAQRTNRLPVQIMVTSWIVAHPWPAMSRKSLRPGRRENYHDLTRNRDPDNSAV
jgi:hypothetical protein